MFDPRTGLLIAGVLLVPSIALVAGPGWLTASAYVVGFLAAWRLQSHFTQSVRVRAREREATAAALAAAKTRFVTDLSHEIRTPMNGVIGMAAALESSDLSSNQASMVATLRASGESMMHLVNQVLDLSRIEAGYFEAQSAPFSLGDLLDQLRALNAPAASTKGIELEIGPVPVAEASRIGDRERIRQVLQNLISNAIKFTEDGTVRVTVALAPGAPDVAFSVADTGIGMEADAVQRIFRPYEQAESDTARRFGGTGLGLAISRQIAERLGGELAAESVPGEGSVFTLRVPLPAEEKAAPGPEGSAGQRLRAVGRRVLIADDNVTNVRVLMALMRRTGAEITAVDNGEDAVAAHAAGSFDAVLMDISMPGMDGITALKKMRQAEAADTRPRTPVIAFTGLAFEHEVREIMAEDFDAHLSKPVDVEHFYEVLGDVLAGDPPATDCAGAA